jgi:hypothetical protein
MNSKLPVHEIQKKLKAKKISSLLRLYGYWLLTAMTFFSSNLKSRLLFLQQFCPIFDPLFLFVFLRKKSQRDGTFWFVILLLFFFFSLIQDFTSETLPSSDIEFNLDLKKWIQFCLFWWWLAL